MNIDQLSAIAAQFQEDVHRSNFPSMLNNLISAFNNLLQASNEAHQNQFNNARVQLNNSIRNAKPFIFPKTWRRNLDELGLGVFSGDNLLEYINDTIDKNVLTPVVARDQLQGLLVEINGISEAFSSILFGFERFEIEPAALAPGEAELSVLIPRRAIDNSLASFSKEVANFERSISIVSELVTGTIEPPKLKRLSNIDPWILAAVATPVVLGYLKIISTIQEIIQNSYKLREVKANAEAAGIHVDILKQMESQVKQQVSSDLGELTNELMKQFPGSKAREAAEFRNYVESTLEGLATRLDHKYQYDGDAGAWPEDEEQADSQASKHRQMAEEVRQVAEGVRYVELPPEPILGLPSPKEIIAEDDDVGQGVQATSDKPEQGRKRRQAKGTAKGSTSPKGSRSD